MNNLENSPRWPIPDIDLISAIAAEPALSHADARLAVALVLMSDDAGRAKGRTAALAAACRIDRRRVVGHLRRLADAGYVRLIDMSRPGRFHIERVLTNTGRVSPFSTDPIERRRCAAAVTSALAAMEDE